MLDANHCRARQQRLLQTMQEQKLDAVAVGARHDVQHLSSHRADWKQHAGFILFADGRSWLASADAVPKHAVAADDVVPYESKWFSTLRQDQALLIAQMMHSRLGQARGAGRIGADGSAVTSQLALLGGYELIPVDPVLWQLRRAKDPDELALMKRAIACTEAMYARARQIIEPGIPEIRVFSELMTVAIETAGEPLSAPLGNDFTCGGGGGPPRAGRVAQAGEIYILDLGPAYRGYFADNARSFAVDRRPTDAQRQAWQHVVDCFKIVEQMARPGVRCRDIFDACDRQLRLVRTTGMPHHLGHGVGLEPHEYPHLNPKWDDVLIEGEIFTAEPGQYGPELRGGLRIENQYRVTRDGVEILTPFPMEL